MTVNIDPSEVRRNGASVKPASRAARFRLPLRAVLIGGIGSAGLIAFTVGAFSFFSGLADPRIRTPRIMPVAAKMPELKDGIPALAPEPGPAAAPQATTLNLPRPGSVEPQSTQPAQQAAAEPPMPQLRTAPSADEPVETASRSADRQEPQEVLAVEDKPRRGVPAKAAPPIQNAAIVAETPRTAALVPPAKAETVKAKPAQSSAFVSLPAGSRPEPKELKPHRDAGPPAQEAHKPAAKPPAQKTAAHRPATRKSAADAAALPDQAAAASADDGDAIPGTRHVRAGLKAIGGMLGISDSD